MADPICSRIFRFAAQEPDRIAVNLLRTDARGVLREEPVSFGDWARHALGRAAALQKLGLKRGDRVLLCMPTGRPFLEAFLGAQALGFVPVPLPSLDGFNRRAAFVKRLASVVRDAAPSAVFADRRTAAYLQETGLLGDDLPIVDLAMTGEETVAEIAPATGDEIALVQYTSGSTDTPRGVVVTANNLIANADAMGTALGLCSEDRVVSWLPLYHDMGLIGGLLAPLAHGSKVWLLSPLEFLLRPATWMKAISLARATLTVAPNFAYGIIARKVPDEDLRGLDLSTLKAAINGAEPVDPSIAEAFCARLAPLGLRASAYYPVYGLAESTLSVAFPPLGRGIRVDQIRRDRLAQGYAVPGEGPGTLRLVSVGSALEGHAVSIVDPQTHEPLPERRLGEIWVTGPSISPWYFEQHQPTRSRRKSLRTGDLGYMADGELYVVDRLKDLVIVGGRNYSPSDIERCAETVDGVRAGRTVAFGVADEASGTEELVLVAEVVPRSDAQLDALAASMKERIADDTGLLPSQVVLLRPGALARTSSGKLMRRDARDRYLAGGLEGERALRPMFAIRLVQAMRGIVLRYLARRRAAHG